MFKRKKWANGMWLLQIYLSNKKETLLMLLLNTVNSLSLMGVAWYVQKLSDLLHKANSAVNLSQGSIGVSVTRIVLIQATFIGLIVACSYLLYRLRGKVAAKYALSTRESIIRHIAATRLSYLEGEKKGEIISRFSSDFAAVEGFVYSNITAIIWFPCCFLVLSAFLIFINRPLYIVSICFIPFVFLLSGMVMKSIEELTGKLQAKIGQSIALVIDAISGIKIIKAFCLHKKFEKNFSEITHSIFSSGLQLVMRISALTPLLYVIRTIPKVLCVIASAYFIYQSKINAGELFPFIFILGNLTACIYTIPNILAEYKKTTGAIAHLSELYDMPTEPSPCPALARKTVTPHSDDGEYIEFCGVSFAYHEGENVLSDVNLSLAKNKITAIVGMSGCGKSTLVKLLLGFYQPQKGRILIGGVELSDDTLWECRDKIAIVSQDVCLFADTIYQNLAAASVTGITEDEIKAACEVANIHTFIESMPMQYQHEIGERAANLSGGEKQRLSIARALLKKSDILVLDEPTSAVDIESEKRICEAIRRQRGQKTILLISHRPATIMMADEILVMENGRIRKAELGNCLAGSLTD